MPTSGTPDWSRLSALVDALLDAPPEQREPLIAELSGGDPRRRAELDRLMADCDRESPLLVRPAAERFASLLEEDAAVFPDTLRDRYRLTRELGRGGMATVYLAHDLKHARDVAVKVVHPMVASALGSDRFLREIEIVAQLRHPHIVPLFDSGDAGGVLYYVMPFESDLSLRQRLASGGSLPLDEVVGILRDVCDALAHAHQRGVVHRDIKPDNVLLSGKHALVTDFGVAKALAAPADATTDDAPAEQRAPRGTNTAGATFGTPAYMAPEQIAGEPPVDHRTDIYAVGVLAYELITGRRPFAGESRHAVLAAHLTEMPAPLSTLRPDVPRALHDLVMRCLAKRPADRWQSAGEVIDALDQLAAGARDPAPQRVRMRWLVGGTAAATAVALGAVALWQRTSTPSESWRARWADAQVERITDFPGAEVDAAISNDGLSIAFLADRDSVYDAFVTRLGSGRFLNLTGGRLPQLFNEDVRNIGFTSDGAHVWVRLADIASPASVSVVPIGGGRLQPFLATAVTVAWSPDESRVAYHETTTGDPIYIADRTGGNAREVFIARPGMHNHHVAWAPDGRFLYFAHGVPPNEMDIWRIPVDGGQAERVTMHQSRVAYPVPLDDRTLLYTATADDGTGPWLYWRDLPSGRSERATTTVEQYLSIAASREVAGQPRRLVATVSNPVVGLWSVPIASEPAGEEAAAPLALPTARSAAPRFEPDGSLAYLASRGGADAVWRLSGTEATQLWIPSDGAVAGAASMSPDGQRLCAPVRRRGRSTLMCVSADGTNARPLAASLDVRGAPAWSPDGRWIAIAAKDSVGVRVYKVPANGGQAVRLVESVSSNPVWSPNGAFVVYSGTPRARNVPVQAVTPDGRPYVLPAISVDRVGDSYRFLADGRLVAKLGGFRRQDFWLIDLATGNRTQLTRLKPGDSLHRFDVSPDGTRIVFERVRENSDVALITLPPRR